MKKALSVFALICILAGVLTGCCIKHDYVSKVKTEPTYDKEGVMEYVCSKCGDTYTEAIPKKELHTIPESVLLDALSDCTYTYQGLYSIKLGELVIQHSSDYEVDFVNEYDFRNGDSGDFYGPRKYDFPTGIDYHLVYQFNIKGKLPYGPGYTINKAYIAHGWLRFDENDNLIDYEIAELNNIVRENWLNSLH